MPSHEYERFQHTTHKSPSSAGVFIDAYAGHCGIVAIDELVRLYVRTFPGSPMDYATMRAAAEDRRLTYGDRCDVWEHDGTEYALAPSLSNAGYAEWYYHHLKRHYWGEYEDRYVESLPGLPERENALRTKLVEAHGTLPVRVLTADEVAMSRSLRIGSYPCVTRLVEELLKVRMRRPDRPKKRATERGLISSKVGSRMRLASTMIDVENSRAYEDAQHLMTFTFPKGSCDFDPLRDEPDPKVLLAAEVAYRELPLWGLNGWSQSETRLRELSGMGVGEKKTNRGVDDDIDTDSYAGLLPF